MISFVLYILAISITIQYTLANNPVCDGSQIVYATPPSIDPLTGEIIGAGLDAITLSVDEANTLISNIIGIASDMHELAPDQQPEMEIIRSASINPLTTDLLLLYQEINYADPLMNEPRQRLVIIPGFKLNSLLVPSPGILGYEINDNIDLSETELDEEYPLTEIAFDCAGNLLGVTAKGELVQMIIEAGSSDLETKYIGPVQFQGAIVGLAQGFVGLTYDFQTNAFVAVGGVPIANTLVQFAVADCVVIQFGDPIIITDQYGLCPLGIVDIESRGNNQFYVSCAIDANTFGLAILELVEGIAQILPINAADGQSLVVLPNSSGGALIASIPSKANANANTNANAVCFPRNIGAPMCNVVPTESDCEGDITIELVMAPPTAGFMPPGLGGVPPGLAGGNIVPPADAVPQTGVSVNAVSGTYAYGSPADGRAGLGVYRSPGYGLETGAGSVGATATGLGTSFNGEVIPGTEGAAFGPAVGGLGLGFDGDDFGEGHGSAEDVDLSVAAQGSSVDGGDDTDNQSEEEEEAADAETDNESEEEEEDVADDDTSADDESEDDDDIEGDDDTSADDESEDDDDAELDDDDEESASDDDNETDMDDDVDDEEDTLDGDGDSSYDDDDETNRDSVDPFSFDFERGSAEDAQLNGNNFNRNGFLNAEDGYNNGQGTMISLSPSTLANLWGLAMIFLGINVTFLCICYYRNGQCQKKQVTVDDNDGDIESL